MFSVLHIQKTIHVQVQTVSLAAYVLSSSKNDIVCFCYSEMSLVRMNRPLYGASKRPVRSRKVSAPKNEWVVRTRHATNYLKSFSGGGAL